MKKNKAFTLIELLVVIAIIGILAGVVIASLGSARAKAKDTRRISDIKQVKTAMDMYYSENGRYPTGVSTGTGDMYYDMGDYASALVPTYLPLMPKDPSCTVGNCAYKMISSFPNVDSYMIKVTMEDGSQCRAGQFTGDPSWYQTTTKCSF